ncbi:hypothetical protein [Pseudocitrobacter cyperus]|uniref:Periplasmic protein n=1 Tax=Pseudocitrobacter cyperus TaxID=3112843 RepID=A0ABV0HFE7_9ENTR
MFLHQPGTTALIIAARTPAGRANIGKAVELFALCAPGERILNPVNGVMTQLPLQSPRALWLVTGDIFSADGQHGFAFVRSEYLLPLTPDTLPEKERALSLA